MFVDTHCHMHKLKKEIFGKVISTIKDGSAGIASLIECPISYESNMTIRERFAETDISIGFAVGVHPRFVSVDGIGNEKIERLRAILRDKSSGSVAVGETGLDRTSENNYEMQKEAFRKHIELAIEEDKPIILHIRDRKREEAQGEAYIEAFEILSEYRGHFRSVPGVVHCFAASYDIAMKFICELGFAIGVGGMFTRAGMDHLEDVIRRIPLQSIILETDTPYLMPAGVSSEWKVNTPLNIPYIAERISTLKGIGVSDVENATNRCAKNIFGS